MAARPSARVPLQGRFVRLEPLTREVLPALYAAIGRPEVFAGGYGGGPARLSAQRPDAGFRVEG